MRENGDVPLFLFFFLIPVSLSFSLRLFSLPFPHETVPNEKSVNRCRATGQPRLYGGVPLLLQFRRRGDVREAHSGKGACALPLLPRGRPFSSASVHAAIVARSRLQPFLERSPSPLRRCRPPLSGPTRPSLFPLAPLALPLSITLVGLEKGVEAASGTAVDRLDRHRPLRLRLRIRPRKPVEQRRIPADM